MTLRQFYAAAAAIHGLDPEPARMLGRFVFQGNDDAAARARGGKDSSPVATAALAARFLIARIGGGQQKDAASRVADLWITTLDGTYSDAATVIGDTFSAMKIPPVCAITGQMTFGDGLTTILSDPALSREIRHVVVRHGHNDAVIAARDGRSSRFVSRESLYATDLAGFFGTIPGGALEFVANLLAG
jgi:hypothetical protein